jgi:hypothetical protein
MRPLDYNGLPVTLRLSAREKDSTAAGKLSTEGKAQIALEKGSHPTQLTFQSARNSKAFAVYHESPTKPYWSEGTPGFILQRRSGCCLCLGFDLKIGFAGKLAVFDRLPNALEFDVILLGKSIH